jgi:glycosyltransferase involved in cell wall biosynthesis
VSDDAPVLLDVTRLIWRRWKGRLPTGIDRVCLAYLNHFAPEAQAVVQYRGLRRILDRRASHMLFELLRRPGPGFKRALIVNGLRCLGRRSGQGRGRIYLNVGHTGLNSVGFRGWALRADVRSVYLVHDLIPITHPQFCRGPEASKHAERMRTVLMTAAGVIGNSRATLDDLAVFSAAEGLPMPPAIAAPLGREPLRPASITTPVHPTFVTIGTIEARKNHALLLEIWSRMIDRLGNNTPKLVIIGQRGWEAEAVFELLDRREKLRGHVIELNNCSDQELAKQIGSARALLFPSHAEGYGLPLIEALGLGVPVIASDLPVFREIGAGIPLLLPSADDAAWEDAILSYAKDPSPARNEQLRWMKSFRLPDWHGHFETVERWLGSLGLAAQAPQHRLD